MVIATNPSCDNGHYTTGVTVDTGTSTKELSIVAAPSSLGSAALDTPSDCAVGSSRGKSNGLNVTSKTKKKSSIQSVDGLIVKKSKSSPVKKMKSQLMKSANTGLLMVAPLTSSATSASAVAQSDAPSITCPSAGLLGGRGPRVKRVCRKNATGLPRATFSSRHSEIIHNENITPDVDNEDGASDGISRENSPSSDNTSSSDSEDDNSSASDSDALPVTEYIMRAFERESASGDNVSPQAKVKSPKKKKKTQKKALHARSDEQMSGKSKNGKTATKSSDKGKSSKDNLSFDCVNENGLSEKKVTPKKKKQGQQVSKSIDGQCITPKKSKSCQSKKAISTKESPCKGAQTSSPVKKLIKKRCGSCSGCTASDCGSCTFCLDKKKFGGPNIIKQACKLRKCTHMTSPVH